jgi:hypothetical protein
VDSGEVDPEMAAMGFNFAGFGGSKKGWEISCIVI